jgi:hypothetical protein
MPQRQINIRLDEEDFKALEAVSFLDGVGVADQLRQVALDLVRERRVDPDVTHLLEIWERRSGSPEAATTVTRLRTGKGPARG